VREKGNGTFALSISHHGVTKHYRIDKQRTSSGERLAIESGPLFDNLMDVSQNFVNVIVQRVKKTSCLIVVSCWYSKLRFLLIISRR